MPAVDDRSPPPIERGRDLSLVMLAASAGVVDAICLTTLGVFTAAVSANAVLIGLALGDADGHTAGRAAIAFAAFGAGVWTCSQPLWRWRWADRPLRHAPDMPAG